MGNIGGTSIDETLFWGIVSLICFAIAIILAIILYRKTASKKQVKNVEDKLETMEK